MVDESAPIRTSFYRDILKVYCIHSKIAAALGHRCGGTPICYDSGIPSKHFLCQSRTSLSCRRWQIVAPWRQCCWHFIHLVFFIFLVSRLRLNANVGPSRCCLDSGCFPAVRFGLCHVPRLRTIKKGAHFSAPVGSGSHQRGFASLGESWEFYADFPFKLKDGEWAMAHSESLQATSVSVEYHGLLKYIFNIYIYGNIRFCP